MLMYKGVEVIKVMVEVDEAFRNPYEAVKNVFVNSARPLKEDDRIQFIAENVAELDRLCEGLYNEWMQVLNPTVKQATHPAPAMLQ